MNKLLKFVGSVILGGGWIGVEAEAGSRANPEVRIEKRVTIVPPGSGQGRGMLGIVRHPEGTIFVNTQTKGLAKSIDEGRTWTLLPARNAFALGITRDGRLWLAHHEDLKELSVAYSSDGGQTWKTIPIDFGKFAPATAGSYDVGGDDYNTFMEGPDGTLTLGLGLRWMPWFFQDPKLMVDGLVRPDAEVGGQFLIRTYNGGASWGDPTLVHPFASEVGYAMNPRNADHILAITRIQRPLLAGEDRQATIKKTGCPPDLGSSVPAIYKNGLLLKSTDSGRTFREVEGGLTDYYELRGTILWTQNNVVVVTHQASNKDPRYGALLARISVDGARAWLDGTAEGTPLLNKSKKYVLVPKDPGHSFTAPTLELSQNRFLTVYVHGDISKNTATISGVFWHLDIKPER